ncbi:MAG: (2Fe-2S)-binding protein [Armatimonadota bacterium]|nr:(2Fe-2S)-binding protein [Armatimonadota bacterium]MDR7448870.1 (2Fe-2S)-binding protein [Armatimonadota bacterium]MDR7458654.1 (2Fe-2S)-binding protein [Armatimonadota bacterium]MDR7479563.1 (2Fe-2S)-binding protein [Armatimonadota bacterium]MDR7489496.1 (2Fe-2S)-binding protein [Armatimonadota bacterium]
MSAATPAPRSPVPARTTRRRRPQPVAEQRITLTVNGVARTLTVPVRRTLADALRDDLGLTGTHLGCEHGVCGACTVLLDGRAVRSCLLLAVQADGREVLTVEGLAQGDRLHPIQEAFWETHALQCGFCTPGFLMTVYAFLRETPHPTDEEIREALAGNLCRCTGYVNILKAVRLAAERLAAGEAATVAREEGGP